MKTFRPDELGSDEIDAWQAICDTVPAFGSPLLAPGFALAVAAHRPDARVAVAYRQGAPVAFFAHHKRPGGLARPLGTPFGDYHALLAMPGEPVDRDGLLEAAGVRRFAFKGLVDPDGLFAGVRTGGDVAWQIALGDGMTGTGYLDGQRQTNSKHHKNWRRLHNKTEREVGAISFNPDDRDPGRLDLLLGWKSCQMDRTGVTNVLRPPWARQFMHYLFGLRGGPVQGQMMTLWAGDTLLAGHFGIRMGGVYHPWMAGINPDHGAQSPGQTYLYQAILAMDQVGLRTYDLSTGHAHYKAPFCNVELTLDQGLWLEAGAPIAAGDARSLMARLASRIDHVASVELSLAGRVRGVASAMLHMGTRVRAASI